MNKAKNYWLHKWLHFQKLFFPYTTNGVVTQYVVNIAAVKSGDKPAVLV